MWCEGDYLGGAGGTVRQRKQAFIHRKDVPCGRYDLTGPGLYSQRELAFVLFFARGMFAHLGGT